MLVFTTELHGDTRRCENKKSRVNSLMAFFSEVASTLQMSALSNKMAILGKNLI